MIQSLMGRLLAAPPATSKNNAHILNSLDTTLESTTPSGSRYSFYVGNVRLGKVAENSEWLERGLNFFFKFLTLQITLQKRIWDIFFPISNI